MEQRDLEGARPVMVSRGPSQRSVQDPFSDDRAAPSTLPPIAVATSPIDFLGGVVIPPHNLSPARSRSPQPVFNYAAAAPVTGSPQSAASMNPFADPQPMPSPAVPSPQVRRDEQFRWSDLSPTKRSTIVSEGTADGDITWSYGAALKPTNPDPATASAYSADGSSSSFSAQQSHAAKTAEEEDEEYDNFEMLTPRPFSSAPTRASSADPFVYDARNAKHESSMTDATDPDPFVYDRVAARQRLSEMRLEPPSPEKNARPPIPRVSIISATSVATNDLGYAV